MQQSDFDFDDDLFGFNLHGLASYLEPSGWHELNAMKSAGDKQIVPRCPASDALSRALFEGVRQRRQWGQQLPHGGWTTATQGERIGKYLVRFDKGSYIVEPTARALSYKEVRKALLGRALAVGTTDRPVEGNGPGPRAPSAACIRIDTDLDGAWLYERHDSVIAELKAQRQAVEAMGLPFLAFTTGGRGVQSIVRLPRPLRPGTCSFLSRGLRMALRGRAGLENVHVDRDAYDGLMRLPCGIHRLGRTGLFVDLDRERLHPVSMQAALLSDCLITTDGTRIGGSLSGQALADAEHALLPELRAVLGSSYAVANERHVLEIVRRAPTNPLSAAILSAHRALGVELGTASIVRQRPTRALDRRSIANCDRSWAEGVWQMDILPGEYWDWVHMGGHRGMLAAVVLFGSNSALDRLQDKAASHRAATPRDHHERHFVNESLWRSFGLKEFGPRRTCHVRPSLPTFGRQTKELARSLASRMKERSGKSKWSEELAEVMVALVLTAIEESREGEAWLSVRDISALANQIRGRGWTNPTRVQEMLRRVCAEPSRLEFVPKAYEDRGDAAPLLPVFVRVKQAMADGEKSLFLPGPAIYGSHVHRKFYLGAEA
jgi:hypothetical protein